MLDDEQSAVLVIRAWREDGAATPLRARITQTVNADAPDRKETAVGGEAEILAVVRAWLEDFASQ
jgi:hypothetical protein